MDRGGRGSGRRRRCDIYLPMTRRNSKREEEREGGAVNFSLGGPPPPPLRPPLPPPPLSHAHTQPIHTVHGSSRRKRQIGVGSRYECRMVCSFFSFLSSCVSFPLSFARFCTRENFSFRTTERWVGDGVGEAKRGNSRPSSLHTLV